MKMINKTNSTSMSGVTLMFALWPPLGPTAIPIWSPLLPRTRRRRRRLILVVLALIRQQAQLVDASRAHVVDNRHHGPKLGPGIGADENPLVHPARQAVFHLLGQLIGRGLVVAKENLAVSHDGYDQRIFLVRIRHRLWVIDFGEVDTHA